MRLAFPEFSLQIKTEKNKNYVFDIIRRKYVFLTSEEWVRQHLIHYLVSLDYPPGMMSVERSLPHSSKRYDMVIYNQKAEPFMLVECKAPKIIIDDKTLQQTAGYLQKLDVKYVLLTNGLNHFCIERNKDAINVSKEIPAFSEISK